MRAGIMITLPVYCDHRIEVRRPSEESRESAIHRIAEPALHHLGMGQLDAKRWAKEL